MSDPRPRDRQRVRHRRGDRGALRRRAARRDRHRPARAPTSSDDLGRATWPTRSTRSAPHCRPARRRRARRRRPRHRTRRRGSCAVNLLGPRGASPAGAPDPPGRRDRQRRLGRAGSADTRPRPTSDLSSSTRTASRPRLAGGCRPRRERAYDSPSGALVALAAREARAWPAGRRASAERQPRSGGDADPRRFRQSMGQDRMDAASGDRRAPRAPRRRRAGDRVPAAGARRAGSTPSTCSSTAGCWESDDVPSRGETR